MFFLLSRPPPSSTLFPYTTLFRSSVLFIQSLLAVQQVPLGFDASNVFTLQFRLPQSKYAKPEDVARFRSEEHTSELQSLRHLVCRLLLEKKKITVQQLLLHRNRTS